MATAREQGKWLAAGMVADLPLLFVVVSYLLWRERLPDPMPSHWSVSGEVDSTVSLVATITTMGVFVGVGALLAWGGVLAHRLTWTIRRMLVVTGAVAGGFGAGLWLMIVTLALDVPDAYQSREPTWQVLVLLLVMVAVPAAVLAALGRAPARSAATGRPAPELPRSPLPEGEQPVWREALLPSGMFLLAPVLLLGVAAVMGVMVNVWAASPLLLVAVVIGLFAAARVGVDQHGLRIFLGPWGWPRITVPLAEIASAEVTEVRPLEWGGWGYRIRPGGRALALRRGPGVRLKLSENREFVTNTQDPQALAGVVNTLIERDRG